MKMREFKISLDVNDIQTWEKEESTEVGEEVILTELKLQEIVEELIKDYHS
jgi:hypothetical protein